MANRPGAGRATSTEDEQLRKCAWLASEGMRLNDEGISLDEKGSTAEAILHYRRASLKLTEAAQLCPAGHVDTASLEGHAQDLQLRVIYLESLDGRPATLPVEDHIAPLELSMDLSAAAPPAEESVQQLVASSGASGMSAALDEVGYASVAALHNDSEMRAYICRVMDMDKLGVKGGATAELDAFVPDFSGTRSVQTLAKLRDGLKSVAWVAPLLDPALIADKMQAAVALETQAKELEARGSKQDAVLKYGDAIRMFQFVLKYDDRMKNARIKEMVETRLSDLEVATARLALEPS